MEKGFRADEVYKIIDNEMEHKKIYIIGIGPGNPDMMSVEAARYIDLAEVVIGAKRMTESADTSNKAVYNEYKAEKIKEIIDNENHNRIAVLYSGDVCLFSGAEGLINILEGYDVSIIQGMSSVSYFASRLGVNTAESKIVSLHGRDEDICNIVRKNKSVFILTSGNISEISLKFIEAGLNDINILIGERLSYKDEKIYKGCPEDFINSEFDTLSLMYVENKNYAQNIELSIDDDEFIRGSVPMTKSEIRTLVLSEMGISTNSIIYDIGAGTGSISIACGKHIENGKVYAIECNENAVDIINRNADKFGLYNIEIVKGYAADVLPLLPQGDIAFIGGSRGQLEDIVRILVEKGVKTIVMTAIAIESANKMLELAKYYKFEYNIKQIMVSRGKRVSDITMLISENPVYIIKCNLGGKPI